MRGEQLRCIVNSCARSHIPGQDRLIAEFRRQDPNVAFMTWAEPMLPLGSPTHQEMPYAFKAWALKAAAAQHSVLLWLDACMVPGPRLLEDLWQKIEKEGIWFAQNGWKNSEWTCEAAYPLLGVTHEENDQIEHVVAGCFGLDMRSAIGQAFLSEYLRLAQNGSFRGPSYGDKGTVHRQDQTAASVICHRLGVQLSAPPDWFTYKGYETAVTCLVANGEY